MKNKIASLNELSKFFPANGKWKSRGFTPNNNFLVNITKKKFVVFYPNHTAACIGGRTKKKRCGSWEEMLELHL